MLFKPASYTISQILDNFAKTKDSEKDQAIANFNVLKANMRKLDFEGFATFNVFNILGMLMFSFSRSEDITLFDVWNNLSSFEGTSMVAWFWLRLVLIAFSFISVLAAVALRFLNFSEGTKQLLYVGSGLVSIALLIAIMAVHVYTIDQMFDGVKSFEFLSYILLMVLGAVHIFTSSRSYKVCLVHLEK